MTLAQIKALFKTGAIPTQADFENLISKIPNSELTEREDGLVIDDSGVAEKFMNTIHANCYKQIQLK